MKPIRYSLVVVGVLLACAASVAGAQTAPTTPTAPGALSAQSGPPPMPANPPEEKVIDGPVKQVDPLAKTVRVGWLLGLFSTTLAVTEDTRIAVDGTTGSLQDIREGDEVKASYEARDGKYIAKSIEVTEAEPRRAADAPQPQRSSPPAGPPPLDPPQGSEAPAPAAPRTPY